ncbi:MAG: hypothetical protein EDQ89_06265 [Acidobacteria bacterium]|nr:MAG: hypothetical protein EDQ89_06265 [Acidobacteriota bacterium]MCL4286287.1 hypothetical protein [Thermoleophilia bacterium]GIK77069.1 MAG: hypothetical protein BroJett022_07590 [Actinomycetes bacterium]
MRLLRIPLVILALVGLIALAGCGGGDGTDSTEATSSDALSDEEYAQEAQAILLEFGTNFQQLGTEISSAKNAQEFSDLVDDAEAEIQGAIDDFGALQPPADAQEGHDQALAALENFSSKLTDVSEAAESGDEQALQEAAQALQEAAVTFETELTQAAESFQEAGVELGGSSTDSTDATTG